MGLPQCDVQVGQVPRRGHTSWSESQKFACLIQCCTKIQTRTQGRSSTPTRPDQAHNCQSSAFSAKREGNMAPRIVELRGRDQPSFVSTKCRLRECDLQSDRFRHSVSLHIFNTSLSRNESYQPYEVFLVVLNASVDMEELLAS